PLIGFLACLTLAGLVIGISDLLRVPHSRSAKANLLKGVAIGSWVVIVALVIWERRLRDREWRPRPRQLCRRCGHDLRGTPEPDGLLLDRCPECGTKVIKPIV